MSSLTLSHVRWLSTFRLTTRPTTERERLANSAVVWLALMAIWVLTNLLIFWFPPGGRPVDPDSWSTHLAITTLGLAAVWCMHRTSFPSAWDTRISAASRLWRPFFVGAAFGGIAIVSELFSGATKILEIKLGTPFTVAFPGSLAVYTGAAIVMEALFLIIPLPILLWLIVRVLLRGRGLTRTFWALAVVSSAAEPALQGGSLMAIADGAIGPGVFAAYVVESFGHNLASAVYMRRAGLLAPVLVRLGHYLVWHIGYGNFIAG